jgi:hypothetical protein
MKNPFHRKNSKNEDDIEKDSSQEEMPAHLSIAQLEKRTVEIEAERERKRIEREEKKFHKMQAEKRRRVERWLAPLFLVVTFIISFFIYWRSQM